MAPKATTIKKLGKKRRKKDVNAPKAPATAYVLFCNDKRAQVKADHPTADFAESNRKLGELWKAAPQEEKDHYKTTAAKARVEYQKVLAKYKAENPKAAVSDDEDGSPKKRKKRAAKDPFAPKKPTSAYFFYQTKIRPTVKEELGEKSSVGDIAKRIAEKWRGLSQSDKVPYVELAEEDRERYRREKAAYDKKAKTTKPVKATKSKKKAGSGSSSEESSDDDSSDDSDGSDSGSGSESSDDESGSD